MPDVEEILVGIDGSAHGRAALAWAMAEARSRGCGVLVVHVSQLGTGLWVTTPVLRQGLRELVQPIVDHALAFAANLDPEVGVRGRILLGSPHRALVSLSTGAVLTVVGRQGKGAVATHLIGSVCRSTMAHAHSPVVAVALDAASRPTSRVVVAVSDRPTSLHHLEFGIEQARRRGVDLVVLHAWQPPRWPGSGAGGEEGPVAPEVQIAAATRRLSAMLTASAVIPATTTVRPVVLTGGPLPVLREFCKPSDLLVLGRHRPDHQLSPALGPVLSGALHKLRCAIAIPGEAVADTVPAEARTAESPWAAGVIAY